MGCQSWRNPPPISLPTAGYDGEIWPAPMDPLPIHKSSGTAMPTETKVKSGTSAYQQRATMEKYGQIQGIRCLIRRIPPVYLRWAMYSGSEAGLYLSRIDSCITQVKIQRPSMTCKESKEEKDCLQEGLRILHLRVHLALYGCKPPPLKDLGSGIKVDSGFTD